MKEQTAKWVLRIFGLVIVATFITFVTLKCCGILPWSWWWITAPLWMAAVAVILLTGVFSIIVIAFASSTAPKKKGGKDE